MSTHHDSPLCTHLGASITGLPACRQVARKHRRRLRTGSFKVSQRSGCRRANCPQPVATLHVPRQKAGALPAARDRRQRGYVRVDTFAFMYRRSCHGDGTGVDTYRVRIISSFSVIIIIFTNWSAVLHFVTSPTQPSYAAYSYTHHFYRRSRRDSTSFMYLHTTLLYFDRVCECVTGPFPECVSNAASPQSLPPPPRPGPALLLHS